MRLKDNSVVIGTLHIESPDVGDFPGHFFNDFLWKEEIIHEQTADQFFIVAVVASLLGGVGWVLLDCLPEVLEASLQALGG